MNVLQPTDIRIVVGLPPQATPNDKVAIDTEWFHMNGERLHRPHGDFACATFSFDGNTVYVVTDKKDIPQAMANVECATHVYHNAKFDIGQLRRYVYYPHRTRLWDVMLIEQIRYAGYYSAGEYALKDLARRKLRLYMSKEVRASFEDADVMTEDMLNYSAVDCAITWRVFDYQRRFEVDAHDLWVWKHIEVGFLFVLLGIGGMSVDKDRWIALASQHQQVADSIQAKYGTKHIDIGPKGGKHVRWEGLNLGSHDQTLEQVHKLGYKDIPDTNEDTIKHLIPECEFIKDLLEFREHDKAASTYGENMLEFVEEDGRIHPDMIQIGAATGRPSGRKPNPQNIPRTVEHRTCFVPTYGMVAVDGDWSAQEPRIFAYRCQDPTMIGIFKQGKDLYIEFARLGFEETITKKDKERRQEMKTTVLGKCYGLTPWGMVKQYNIPLERGRVLMDRFDVTFPKAAEFHKHAIADAKRIGYVETIYHRKYWLNTYQWGWENNVDNSPVQGSAADAMKIATYRFNDQWGWQFEEGLTDDCGFRFFYSPIINIIHDEILLEVPPELMQHAEEMLRTVMISVAEEMHKGIPADVELGHGSSWGEAHK